MRRAMYFTAVCLFACCITSMCKAEEEHSGRGKPLTGSFDKTGDKLVFKTKDGKNTYDAVQGDKANDATKAMLADPATKLIGQGDFIVAGPVKDTTLSINNIRKAPEHK